MKNKYGLSLLAVASIMALVACGGSTNVGGGSSISGSSSQGGTSSVISNDVEEEYVIVIRETVGLTITSNKQKAKKGEMVELTVVVSEGYQLVKVKLNGTELPATDVANGKYAFTMPNRSAEITAEVAVTGDVVIGGSVAVALEKDDSTGIYVARGVKVSSTAYLSYFVGGTKLSITAIDNTKSFADIDLIYPSTEASFSLAGNATYDFYYDPACPEEPCYIVRTGITEAPKSVEAFQSLFSGRVKSEPTTFPQNVKKVTYSNTATGDNYEWNKYASSSLAQSKYSDGRNAVVYKAYTDSIYSVVDTYVEGSQGNNDATKLDDNEKKATKFEVVDALQSGKKKYQMTEHDAKFDVQHYSHDMYSLDFDIHYGYRTHFDMTQDTNIKAANVALSSISNADGGFTTTIDSYRTLDESNDTTIDASQQKKMHDEYHIEFTFDKAGAPLSGSFVHKEFNEKLFNFTTLTYKEGVTSADGVVEKEMNFAYEYGAVDKTDSFDASPYFLQKIENLTIVDENAKQEGNAVVLFDEFNDMANENGKRKYVKFDAFPETALDTWQYNVIASSNTAVIDKKSEQEPYIFRAIGAGETELTIGNHTSNDVTAKANVKVVSNDKLRNVYLVAYEGYADDDIVRSDEIKVNAGCKKRAKMQASCTTATGGAKTIYEIPYELNFRVSKPELLKVTRVGTNAVEFDASSANVTEITKVYVTVSSEAFDTDWISNAMGDLVYPMWTIDIMPYSKPSKSIFTRWSDESDHPTDPVIADVKQYVSGDSSTYSTLSLDGQTYKFTVNYDENTGKISAHAASYNLEYIELVYDAATDQIGIFATAGSWGGLDDISSEILLGNYSSYDDEYNEYVVSTYYFLDRAA